VGSSTATATAIAAMPPEPLTWFGKLRRAVIGKPRDLADRSVFHTLALIPVLAWIGLGADALSSSAYGPEEAFKALHGDTYMAVALALATALTVALISAAYSALIENFPNGGGYGVASRLLGSRVGLVSGCALLVDYVLTITTSIAAAGDAIYSFMPDFRLWPEFSIFGLITIGAGPDLLETKLPFEVALLGILTILNLRGVKESVVVLTPMFLLFVITHLVLLGAGFLCHIPQMPNTIHKVGDGFSTGYAVMGIGGMAMLLARAYSLGGGTYTGIEAVSNALPLLREPRVANAQRTMLYLAVSLAVTAGGLVLCYLLWGTEPQDGQTMNAVLAGQITHGWPGASTFVVLTLLSEATLLVVAAQAGFLGGPRVLANMAVDSWLPHSFSSISERLTTENGVLLMAGAALGALLYTKGSVDTLVVMYSINVFVTFSLTMAGMTLFWFRERNKPLRIRRLVLFGASFALCAIILCVTVWSKFSEGGWHTLAVTGLLIGACSAIRWHYRVINGKAAKLYADLGRLPLAPPGTPSLPLKADQPTAVILVAAYGGLGIHTLLNVMRIFPGHYHQVVFLSVGVVDSGNFKGEDSLDALRARTRDALDRYVRLATALKIPATARMGDGIDAVDTAESLCLEIANEYPRAVFFAGKLVFRNESWYQRLLHNNTAIALQKRLHWAGKAMVVMPARIQ
jgi:amino acid transporter